MPLWVLWIAFVTVVLLEVIFALAQAAVEAAVQRWQDHTIAKVVHIGTAARRVREYRAQSGIAAT